MAKYNQHGSVTLFDAQNRKENLSALGNPLERLSQVIDFDMFREALEEVFENKSKKNNAGAYDVVMMFKVMVIKHYYNLSDHQVQYQITDRQSFKDFLGLASGDKVPDEKTIWAFSEKLASSSKRALCQPLRYMIHRRWITWQVEHVFGFEEGSMNRLTTRTIG